jgi:hypothetical protein
MNTANTFKESEFLNLRSLTPTTTPSRQIHDTIKEFQFPIPIPSDGDVDAPIQAADLFRHNTYIHIYQNNMPGVRHTHQSSLASV